MKSSKQASGQAPVWPRHFYLIAAGHTRPHHKPGVDTMGSKAFNLMRMANIGLPVPPALVIGTHYTKTPGDCMEPLAALGLPALEEVTGRTFGDARLPLIVSVRSGAPVSMPGMMETLLNIGLSDVTLPGFLRQTGNPRLVWDAYRRLVASYGEVVAGLPAALFEEELRDVTRGRDERQLDFSELRDLTRRFLSLYQQNAGHAFPQDAGAQLTGAIRAVFLSWHSDKAKEYRRLNRIDPDIGTAVTVQAMVFGNTGGHSGAGVGFTRDPTTGEPAMWVDFLAMAQGEDVVSGRRNAHGHQVLASVAPDAWQALEAAAHTIEREFSDMQDFEFTVQDGVLHMLQSRSGKRSRLAAARIALDLLDEGLIDAATAHERTLHLQEQDIGTMQLASQGRSKTSRKTGGKGDEPPAPLAHAMSACPGVVSGEIALDGERAAARAAEGINVILVRQDAETGDIAALEQVAGLLTQRGARTSHAAVVARQLGKVCLVGCEALHIDAEARSVRLGELTLGEGDVLTLDGNSGAIHAGTLAAVLVPDAALLQRLRALRTSQNPAPGRKRGK